ncbi:MAG: N-acetylglucosamine kinase [Pedobacter sp.]|nr:MAG: N-acetylglucosamine kinase [Pedobacter sp.]
MILVADSGSSKTDWKGFLNGEELNFNTAGVNPYFLNASEIIKVISKNKKLASYGNEVKEIYFFGAGSSSPDKHEIVSNGLSALFPNAFISVDNDLIGSAYATCGKTPGFTCILGTGSNVSYYDGKEIHNGRHGLGYVLGDEGSGTWFGKKLLVAWLYGTLPEDLQEEFGKTYDTNKETVITTIYKKPFPNIYLASFSRFMGTYKQHPYIQQLLDNGFQEFVDTNLKDQLNPDNLSFNFVGSIAYYYGEELKRVCERNNIRVGNIIQKPIDGLFQFILEREGVLVK